MLLVHVYLNKEVRTAPPFNNWMCPSHYMTVINVLNFNASQQHGLNFSILTQSECKLHPYLECTLIERHNLCKKG